MTSRENTYKLGLAVMSEKQATELRCCRRRQRGGISRHDVGRQARCRKGGKEKPSVIMHPSTNTTADRTDQPEKNAKTKMSSLRSTIDASAGWGKGKGRRPQRDRRLVETHPPYSD